MRFPVQKFTISGHSMEPYLSEGDQVLGVRFLGFKVGDVVIFKYKSRHLIKRVTRIESNEVTVSGDNKSDSLDIPKIQKKDIMGKVILKI